MDESIDEKDVGIDLYDVLDISHHSTQKKIRRAFRTQSRKKQKEYQLILKAKKILTSPHLKKQWDNNFALKNANQGSAPTIGGNEQKPIIANKDEEGQGSSDFISTSTYTTSESGGCTSDSWKEPDYVNENNEFSKPPVKTKIGKKVSGLMKSIKMKYAKKKNRIYKMNHSTKDELQDSPSPPPKQTKNKGSLDEKIEQKMLKENQTKKNWKRRIYSHLISIFQKSKSTNSKQFSSF